MSRKAMMEPTQTYAGNPREHRSRAAPVRGLRVLPGGKFYDFDTLRRMDRRQRKMVIGRDSRCHVHLADESVSMKHCIVEWDPRKPGGVLKDCRSKNGTWLNGAQIQQACFRNGDLLTIGKLTLVAVGDDDVESQEVRINAVSLREFLERACKAYPTLSKAAEHLGLPRSTLQGWREKDRFSEDAS